MLHQTSNGTLPYGTDFVVQTELKSVEVVVVVVLIVDALVA
jgi:hypothetical protein